MLIPYEKWDTWGRKYAANFLFLCGFLYLLACFWVKPWQREILPKEALRQYFTSEQGQNTAFRVTSADQPLRFIWQNQTPSETPPSPPSTTGLPLYTSLTPFHRVTMTATLKGSGELLLYFDQKHQYSVRGSGSDQFEEVRISADVYQDALPELRVLQDGDAPNHPLEVREFSLKGKGQRSMGKYFFPLFLCSFVIFLIYLESQSTWTCRLNIGQFLVLALFPRLAYALYIQELPFSDMADYERIALGILSGNEQGHHPFFRSFYSHGLSWYVVLIYFCFGLKNYLLLRISQIVLLLMTVLALFGIGKLLNKPRVGWIAAFLLIFSQESVFWGAKLSTEHLFSCFLVFSLLFMLLSLKKQSPLLFLFTGNLCGYVFFIRSVTQFSLLIFMGLMLVIMRHKTSRLLSSIALFWVGFLLILTPWMMRSLALEDRVLFTGTGGWFSFVHQNNDLVSPGEFGGRERQDFYQTQAPLRFANDALAADWVKMEALDWVAQNPIRYLQLSLGRVKMLFWREGDSLTKVNMMELNFIPGSYFSLFSWNPHGFVSIFWLWLGSLLVYTQMVVQQFRHKQEKWGDVLLQHLPMLTFGGISVFYILTLSFPRYRDPLLPLVFLIIAQATDYLMQLKLPLRRFHPYESVERIPKE